MWNVYDDNVIIHDDNITVRLIMYIKEHDDDVTYLWRYVIKIMLSITCLTSLLFIDSYFHQVDTDLCFIDGKMINIFSVYFNMNYFIIICKAYKRYS